jgi:uncharacterized cupredoxin-like copper-binding protein
MLFSMGMCASAVSQSDSFGQPDISKNITRTVVVRMTDAMRFSPGAFVVRQGETVRLHIVNDTKVAHEFVLGTQHEISEHAQMMRWMVQMPNADASSVRLDPGESADIVWKFSLAGKFHYACLIPGHREAGMQGTVMVTSQVNR